jgi:23S rRNA pseudouridine1911/1915/1917 synthase
MPPPIADPPPADPPAADPPAPAASVLIEAKEDHPRLDLFLAAARPDLSRSRIKALIEEGWVVSADAPRRLTPARRVKAGERFRLTLPPPSPSGLTPAPRDLAILYEDEDVLVIDKPAGLVVHPAPGNAEGTLVHALLAHCGPGLLAVGGAERPGIVHRLDKDTSGVMVIAKTDLAMRRLQADFAARRIERRYLALVWGVPVPAEGAYTEAIRRDPRDRKRMAAARSGGKPALTRYRVERAWAGAVALLGLTLGSGRTHQIRVHCAAHGHPLIGDPVYLRRLPAAARRLPEPLARRLLDFPRQALHAARLGFTHPRHGTPLRFETPLPADIAALLDALAAAENA